MKYQIALAFLLTSTFLFGQSAQKKIMTPEVFDEWMTIGDRSISNNGDWIAYELTKEGGDGRLALYNTRTEARKEFARGTDAQFSADNGFLVFKIKPAVDSIRAQKMNKVKKSEQTKDSLGIYNLGTAELTKIEAVASFKLPEKWAGYLAFQKEAGTMKGGKKAKKESKSNGSLLVLHHLKTARRDTIPYVNSYLFAKKGQRLVLHTTGQDSILKNGVYLYHLDRFRSQPLITQTGKYTQLTIAEDGKQVAFIADRDTTKAKIRPFELFYWKQTQDSAKLVADEAANFLMEDWMISNNRTPQFSQDGSKLYFGTAPKPALPDTTLLKEEKAVVEVWSYTDPILYTQQKVQLNREKRRTYWVAWQTANGQFAQLADELTPNVSTADEGNGNVALAYNDLPYRQRTSWEAGPSYRDLYWINVKNGKKTLIQKEVKGRASLSPKGKYAFWFSATDTAWFTSPQLEARSTQITNNEEVAFYDAEDDHPMLPSSHGFLGWLENDQAILIYDKYDIWQVDPSGAQAARRLTNGRKDNTLYRYVQLDREERSIAPDAELLLLHFDEVSKEQGYSKLNLKTGKLTSLFTEPTSLSRRPIKAQDADDIVFTKEDFQTFPNLLHTTLAFNHIKQVSDANPQQSEYRWGTMELTEWTSLDGQKLQGLLVKPDDFDPNKKYPLLVNFYERSSDGLYRHRAPYPHRSTINYAYYVNRGYVIFNPDVPYRIGYPGESAYNAVIPGVTQLIGEGYIDEERIGVQGHSWGGYQIAYLLTKTNIFKCAESGAPVVNMISAYGGIRWGSGMSRMFQYEQTQSRIGGTLWEYPLRYIENSPIFFADKIQTPVLILHNDNDSAVPWYQGIEFFVAMRRLGKPAWMLNYNNEPHWPLKRPNRLDFNLRMQQFFDHYLMDQPKPVWMEEGVPAVKKGIEYGVEYVGDKH